MCRGSFLISHFSGNTVPCAALIGKSHGTGVCPDPRTPRVSSWGKEHLMLPVCPLVSWDSTKSRMEKKTNQKQTTQEELGNVTSLPLAKAKPPPSRKRMFHGIFSWTTFHSRRGGGARNLLLPSGTQKRDFVKPLSKRKQNFLVGGEFGLESGIPSVSKLWNYRLKQTLGAPATEGFKTWLAKALMNDLVAAPRSTVGGRGGWVKGVATALCVSVKPCAPSWRFQLGILYKCVLTGAGTPLG